MVVKNKHIQCLDEEGMRREWVLRLKEENFGGDSNQNCEKLFKEINKKKFWKTLRDNNVSKIEFFLPEKIFSKIIASGYDGGKQEKECLEEKFKQKNINVDIFLSCMGKEQEGFLGIESVNTLIILYDNFSKTQQNKIYEIEFMENKNTQTGYLYEDQKSFLISNKFYANIRCGSNLSVNLINGKYGLYFLELGDLLTNLKDGSFHKIGGLDLELVTNRNNGRWIFDGNNFKLIIKKL